MRKRHVAKWLGTLFCTLIALAFVYSTRRAVTWTGSGLSHASLVLGRVGYGWIRDDAPIAEWKNPPKPGWSNGSYGGSPKIRWRIAVGDNYKYWRGISVPLWMPFVVLFVPTTVLWYRDRRDTARAFRRLLIWMTPRRRRRVTFWKVLLCCVLHIAALFAGVYVFQNIYAFFVDYRPGDPVFRMLELLSPVLFWTTPLWALLWTWLWTLFRNSLFRRQPGEHCMTCGYNLTGNASGRCPECGESVGASLS